jgi:putative transposase
MSKKIHLIALNDQEHDALQTYVKMGIHSARSITRARILLLAHAGKSDAVIAREVGVCQTTPFNVRRRYCCEGLQAVLTEKPRPGAPRKLDGRGEAHFTVLACSKPPKGRQRWTTRLLADRVVAVGLVDALSYRTVGRLLKKRDQTLAKTAMVPPPDHE